MFTEGGAKMGTTMRETGAALRAVVTEAAERLLAMPEAESVARPAPAKWSKKEELGHLIDSAANNHQRFVRAQQAEELALPGYEQEFWVGAQGYADAPWRELVALWRGYNLHLARVIERIPAGCAERRLVIGGGQPATLEFVVEDYLRHLKHHLGRLLPGQ
jgi:hypothetical protein